MNLSRPKGCSTTYGEGQSCEPPVPWQASMVDHVPTHEFSEHAALAAHANLRQLVRLIQCPQCSHPFTAPVTLPCGHTLCRACLPPLHPRTNISYPNTPDRLTGIVCPVAPCGAEHAAAECNVDVTLTKLMELISLELSKHNQSTDDTPIELVEILLLDDGSMMDEKNEKSQRRGHCETYYGGRLLSAFTMAASGKLHYTSDLEFNSLSPTGDDYQHLDIAMLNCLREVAHTELDCLVCYNIMLDPTTTPCGHTFCHRCLDRVMDHSNICPMCRRVLDMPVPLRTKPRNLPLASLLDILCPDLVATRAATVDAEEQAGDSALNTPIFICTLALPAMPTFLHIFEPRYRLMIRRCLEGNRQFGMVMYNRNGAPQGDLGDVPFLEYGTLLEIVNYEILRDGRIFVETRGVGRFKVLDHGMLDGYNVGRVERVEDVSLSEEGLLEQQESIDAQNRAELLRQQNPEAQLPIDVALARMSTQDLLENCMNFVRDMRTASAPWLSARIVQVYGEPPNDPALFPYWFACVLPVADEEKYALLRTTRVRERLMIVYSWIGRIRGSRGPSGTACNIL
ncbi:PUA-like domain-containing protein [Massariosphaeria phaeospora]|uniref:PUA-like domain-containing protein n=1 Tax=Massariosphaeria phaeospora TaxID=100035 RepID=A0A7C8I5S6_9PLEO|nr:PUA-like domain-containing protein [Massariosphaeria phaeospora]